MFSGCMNAPSLNKLHRNCAQKFQPCLAAQKKKNDVPKVLLHSVPKKNSVRPPRVKRLTGQKDLD